MTKLTQAASLIALVAATSSAVAWYPGPVVPLVAPPTPELIEQQMQTIFAQQEAFAEQQMQAMEQSMEAERRLMDRSHERFAPWSGPLAPLPFADHPLAAVPAFPEVPPLPEFGQYPDLPELGQLPAHPELPPVPEFGKIPSMPDDLKSRLDEMDAHRAQVEKAIAERRAAVKVWSEQRRAHSPYAADPARMLSYAPGIFPAMPAPVPSAQAAPAAPAAEPSASPSAPATPAQ
jgi:hypothetical protein